EHGRVPVRADFSTGVDDDALRILQEFNAGATRDLAFTAPAFSLPAARWAAVTLYRGCQFVVCRDVEAKRAAAMLAEPCPEPRSAQTDYSVDLVFRYLPGLVDLARRISSNDPLVSELLKLSRTWPLSSVGLAGVGAVDIEPFIDHAALRQLYVDR